MLVPFGVCWNTPGPALASTHWGSGGAKLEWPTTMLAVPPPSAVRANELYGDPNTIEFFMLMVAVPAWVITTIAPQLTAGAA